MLYLFIYVDQGRWAATTSRTISEASMRFPWDDWDTIRSRDRNVNGWSDGPDGTRSSTRGSTPGPMARHVLGAPTSRRARETASPSGAPPRLVVATALSMNPLSLEGTTMVPTTIIRIRSFFRPVGSGAVAQTTPTLSQRHPSTCHVGSTIRRQQPSSPETCSAIIGRTSRCCCT